MGRWGGASAGEALATGTVGTTAGEAQERLGAGGGGVVVEAERWLRENREVEARRVVFFASPRGGFTIRGRRRLSLSIFSSKYKCAYNFCSSHLHFYIVKLILERF